VILTGTVDQFNAACKVDLDKARAEITRLKAMKSPRNTMQALQAFDNANLDILLLLIRASLAQEVEPDEGIAQRLGEMRTGCLRTQHRDQPRPRRL